MNIFEQRESNVRSYCRSFPVVFERAQGAELVERSGKKYLDFFAGAGALNYGHNDETIRDAIADYLGRSGVIHSLDMMTVAKGDFIQAFQSIVLAPRSLEYKVQFTGPTGTNCVEAALKLARKVTGRRLVVSFTNGFHGMTLGALAVTGNRAKRAGAGVSLTDAYVMPYDGYVEDGVDTATLFERMLDDPSSGLELPAAVILETVQAEGGVNVASPRWLRSIASICRARGILLIVDDIQVGCGRTGPFFSFERAGITPDIVCLSKSLSGFGLPLAMVLLRPDIDVWQPGEHNGTFRGFNLAFVAARAALEKYWRDDALTRAVESRAETIRQRLRAMAELAGSRPRDVRGLGLIQGISLPPKMANSVSRAAFERGVIIETAGPSDEVLKLLPPLTISDAQLARGLDVLEESLASVIRTNSNVRPMRRGMA